MNSSDFFWENFYTSQHIGSQIKFKGISIGDHLWMSRYILHRAAEQFGVIVSLEPRLDVAITGGWFGSGCHTNYSTASMRADGKVFLC